LQRSVDEPGEWADMTYYTTNQTGISVDDGLDNQVWYYRIGIGPTFTSGTATVTLSYAGGGKEGVVRIHTFLSSTSVNGRVLVPIGYNAAASEIWSEGAWSTERGWPSAVALHEGRMWWSGLDNVWGSISDGYDSFDEGFEGDAGPISRSVGYGPVETINWLLPLQRLLIGTASAEIAARSSSFEEPLTPTNFNLKDASTQGSAPIQAHKIDKRGVFVQNGATRVFELVWDFEATDYSSRDLMLLVPDLGAAGIAGIAVQRKPDTRVHVWFDDGDAAVLVFNKAEDVECWVEVETTGDIEDVFVMPGTTEDLVYYCVKRTINGSTVRYLEKWALESECVGGTTNKQADSFVTFSQASSATVSGLSHLDAASVVVWANGKCLDDANGDIATFTVASGAISLTDGGTTFPATSGVVGLAYTASFKSTKLAYAAEFGTPLLQPKQIDHVGLILKNTHHKGVKYGPDADNLDDMPAQEEETDVTTDTIHSAYDEHSFEFNGTWDTDSRLCLYAYAPRPANVLAAVVTVTVDEKI
jgi:hypothetical protein